MWIITERGEFYSAVNPKKPDGGQTKIIRSRDERSSQNLADFINAERGEDAAQVEIERGNGRTDYEFRVICSNDEWMNFVDERMLEAEATNVKTEVGKNLRGYKYAREFLNAMHDTWSIWFRYQDIAVERNFDLEEPDDTAFEYWTEPSPKAKSRSRKW